jgi:signal peptidase I
MSPTLNDGDRILLSYQVEPLERGDIVALRYPDDPSKTFIKRIIGLPGDRVAVDGDGSLLINDVIQDEPFIERERNHDAVFKWRRSDYTQAPVPPNCYFVMGDNRDFSNESRSWGPVRRDLIWGKYVMRYWSGQ